jgi:hypothetical protein
VTNVIGNDKPKAETSEPSNFSVSFQSERDHLSRNRFFWARKLAGALLLLSAVGCTERPLKKQYAEVSELYDSKRCAQCHPKHYDEWSASMHAYAADDPVFLAMNQRGQEETSEQLGTLCVGCHAPLAVELGIQTDGLNLEQIPANLRGVTCYFCHNVDELTSDHNNGLGLAMDFRRPGDCTGDHLLDFDDWVGAITCLSGPDSDFATGCSCADSNGDGDVSLHDFAELQREFLTP